MENLHPQVGDRVRVRQRTWHVQDVDEGHTARVLTLAGFDTSGQACELRVLHPMDDVLGVSSARPRRRMRLRRWRRICRAVLQDDGGPTAMHRAAAANVDVLPFQLEPALALLGGLGTRVLIADDVGLGKTIQALLCASELRARAIARRVLVLCPAGLRDQWVSEAGTRLQLPFILMDQYGMRRLASRLPPEVNPWSVEPLVVASVDYAKRPEVLPAVAAAGWDLVIVDEAHGCCGESDRQQAVSALCASAPYVMLLSATPHNGDEQAFSTLCNLGRLGDDLLVFRRTRLEAGRDSGRRVHRVRVRPSPAERRMHAALDALSRAVRQERADLDRSAWLMLALLHKRALSSPFALAASAERRLRWLEEGVPAAGTQLLLPWDDEAGELDGADAAPQMWQAPALGDISRERLLLQRVVDAAHEAEGADSKLRRLHRLLRAIREPVIVFTEYRDTLQHVRAHLAHEAVLMHGGMSRDQRRAALEAFRSCGVLLATDAASEGLNLQGHARVVINLELPWNPMRLEQRIGRVDRIGQRRRVHAFHLIAQGTGETRLLARLTARVSVASARAGAPDPLTGRPQWTEDASARMIVLHEESPDPPSAPMQAPPVGVTRLEPEARSEAARLSFVRALQSVHEAAAGVTVDTATGIARTDRPQTRRRLRSRTLRIFRTRIVDISGRTIAARVAATAASADAADPVQHSSRAVIATAAHATWLNAALDVHGRLTATRLRRAEALAGACVTPHEEQQPGLFDRRTERTWEARAAERLAARAAALARVEAIRAASRVGVTEPELMLVLETGGHEPEP